jgi:hypothetical protein
VRNDGLERRREVRGRYRKLPAHPVEPRQ